MVDVISALTAKRTRLIQEQRSLETEYQAKKAHIGHELQMINHALDTINEAVEPLLCSRCHGAGTIRVCDAAGDMDDETCQDCAGTGVKLKEDHHDV